MKGEITWSITEPKMQDRLCLLEERQKVLGFELRDLTWRYGEYAKALMAFDEELRAFDLALQERIAQEERGAGRH